MRVPYGRYCPHCRFRIYGRKRRCPKCDYSPDDIDLFIVISSIIQVLFRVLWILIGFNQTLWEGVYWLGEKLVSCIKWCFEKPIVMPEGLDCSVCMVNPKNMMIQSCRHVCLCEECSRAINYCPLCRVEFRPNEIIKVFI